MHRGFDEVLATYIERGYELLGEARHSAARASAIVTRKHQSGVRRFLAMLGLVGRTKLVAVYTDRDGNTHTSAQSLDDLKKEHSAALELAAQNREYSGIRENANKLKKQIELREWAGEGSIHLPDPEVDASQSQAATHLDPTQAEAFAEAVSDGNLMRVRQELEQTPALAQYRLKNGDTPLHHARDVETAKLLLSRIKRNDAAINAKNSRGVTLLHSAATRGEAKLVEFLVSKGADVNARSASGATPVRWAAIEGHHNVVEILRKSGATEDIGDITSAGYDKV